MAFEGRRNTYESIPNFSTNKYKASPTQDDGAYGSLGQPLFPSPSFKLPENHHTPWPNNAEDPFQLLQCSQNSTRNLPDGTDCDGVTDLYGLVTNILEDGDSSDRLSHTERNSSKFTSIWSPQMIGNDLLQYTQSDATTEANPAFSPYDKYNNQVQGQIISKEINDIFQQLYGFNTSNNGLSKSFNGDMDSYKHHPLKLTKPPGLPMPSMESCFLPAMRDSQQNLISNDASRGTIGPLKNFPIQKNAFGHQGKMDSHLVNDYANNYIQSSIETNQQNSPQDVNKLLSHFKDVMATKERMVGKNNIFKLTNSAISPDSALRTPVRRGPGGDIGPVQKEPNGGIMLHTIQDNYRFQGHNTKHIQQSTSNSASCNPIKSYQSKVITHGPTTMPNVNQVLNQYSQDQMQQSQLPNKASRDRGHVPFNQRQPVSEFGPGPFPQSQRSPFHKQDFSRGDGRNVHHVLGQSQMGLSTEPLRKEDGDTGFQGEKSKLHSTAGGFVQDGFLSTQCTESNTRLHTNPHNRDRVPRHGLPQRNHIYFPQSGNTHGSQRFGVGNSTADIGKQQFLPLTYPVSDPRSSSFQMGVNSNSNLSFRPSQPYGSGPSCRDLWDRRPEGEFAASKPNIAVQMAQSAGGSMYPDMASAKSTPQITKNRGGPMSQLHYYLEECCNELTCLEKERKKSVILLNKTFAGRRVYVATSTPLPKMPPNPSRVDRLIVDQIREHSRVLSLLGKIEPLCSFPIQGYVHSTLDRHYEAIFATQTRRREECVNSAGHQKQGSAQDIIPLAVALKDLCSATRKTRTALWCTLQAAVPMSAGVLDVHGDDEAPAVTEGSAPARRS